MSSPNFFLHAAPRRYLCAVAPLQTQSESQCNHNSNNIAENSLPTVALSFSSSHFIHDLRFRVIAAIKSSLRRYSYCQYTLTECNIVAGVVHHWARWHDPREGGQGAGCGCSGELAVVEVPAKHQPRFVSTPTAVANERKKLIYLCRSWSRYNSAKCSCLLS